MSTYNGWSNYETWNVNLWLDNDEGSQDMKREIIASAEKPHQAMDALKQWVEEMMPRLAPSMFSDLLQAAVDAVDWHEIVMAEWEELHPVEEEEAS